MLHLFILRKFLAGLVLALHLTPGRRLCATIEKCIRCGEFLNPPDGFMKALLDLLSDAGWSNSLEDLGTAAGLPKDNTEDFLNSATIGVLVGIVDKLLKSRDFKVRDMALRHEINLEIKTVFEGGCSHNPSSLTSERAVALFVSGGQGDTMTFAELQYHLKLMKLSKEEKHCEQCGKGVIQTVQRSAKKFYDPDFLTVVLEQPTNFSAPLKPGTKYGSSRYMVKTVVHWINDKGSASVSREKKDGWWWHGVDNSQGPDFSYNAEQISSSAHLRDVAVMMMVRMGEERTEQQQADAVGDQEERKLEEAKGNFLFVINKKALCKSISDDAFSDSEKECSDDENVIEELNHEEGRRPQERLGGLEVNNKCSLHSLKNSIVCYLHFVSFKVSDSAVSTAKDEYPCVCGYTGPIANHLQISFHCVQVLKDQAGIGSEMPDEEFCVRTALLVGECPAFCCPGGDHREIPGNCVKWWKSVGWNMMQWEGQPKDVTSDSIKKRSDRFVKDLENRQVHRQSQIKQSDRRGQLGGGQRAGNSEDIQVEKGPPSFAPSQIPVRQHLLATSTDNDALGRNAEQLDFQQTVERVKVISRAETPDCLHVKQLIPLGISYAASLGILCRWPSLPIVGNSIVPMNGDCIFTCFIHANNPTLRGDGLKQAVWELRIKAVGTFIDRLKLFSDEQWTMLQAIVIGEKEVTLSRYGIRKEMEKYMESGEYSGNFGDVIINIAASFSEQPVLVLEVKGCRVTHSHWVDPNEMFGGQNKSPGCPVVVLSQMNHYEVLPIADEGKDSAGLIYQQWKTSERVGLPPGRGNPSGNLNQSADHDVVGSQMGNLMEQTMLEPDGAFSPPLASTPAVAEDHDNPQQQQFGGMDCDESMNQVRLFFKNISKNVVPAKREQGGTRV